MGTFKWEIENPRKVRENSVFKYQNLPKFRKMVNKIYVFIMG